jgi:hypothetical protein
MDGGLDRLPLEEKFNK